MKIFQSFWTKLLIFIVAVVLLGYFGVNPLLNKLLKEQVESKLIGNFSYEYDTIQVDIFSRSVILKNVAWQFPKDSSSLKHKGKVKHFAVKGISWTSIFGNLKIKSLDIESPEFNSKIEVNKILNQKEDTVRLDQFDFYNLIKGQINSLEIDQINITDAEAKWLAPDFETVWRKVSGGELHLSKIVIDSATTAKQNGMFGLEQFELSFNNASIYLPDSLHQISFGKSKLNYREQSAEIDSFQINVLLSDQEIYKQFKYEKTAISLLIPKISLSETDYSRLFTQQYIDIGQINIKDLKLNAYKDKNSAFPYFKKPPLPQGLIQQLSKKIKVDKISVHNAYIAYEQKAKETDKKGGVFFSELNASITHLTNDSLLLKNDPITKMTFNTKLYNKSLLKGTIYFDMTSKTLAHTVEGELSPIDLTVANKALTPLLAYQIRSGQLSELKFRFNADIKNAQGDLDFLYENFKIDKLDKKNMKGNQFDEQLFSFIANGFVIKNSNPDWKGKERKGNIQFERNVRKSIFHYWWNAILSGMQSIILPGK